MRASPGLSLGVAAALIVFDLSEHPWAAALALAAVAAATIAVTIAYSSPRRRALVDEQLRRTGDTHTLDSTNSIVEPRFERLLVMTAEQALEDSWLRRVHPLDRGRVHRKWRAWCADPSPETFTCTYLMLMDEGRTIWVDEETVCIRNLVGAPRWYERHLVEVAGDKTADVEIARGRPRCDDVGWSAAD